MLSRVFIDRPIFAWVIAIIIMLAGAGAIKFLPVEQYPDVAPPQVSIRATYPGASADTLQNSVTQVIEQSLTGIDGMLYFQSTSSSRGSVTITVTFNKGTNPDTAQVQVQNQVQQSLSRLPTAVQQQGLVVRKSNPDDLLVVAIYDETDRLSNLQLADFLTSNMQDDLSRIQGVGDSQIYGAPFAMRIWLDPRRLAAYSLMPSDITKAITAQNAEVAAGELGGQPMPDAQALDATVTAQSRLQTPEQFANIVVKTQPSGGAVHLSDVSRVELGADSYGAFDRINAHPGSGVRLLTSPGADALKTADLVKAEVQRLSPTFPPGVKVIYANDTTDFIKLSVKEVVITLFEAILLVVVVMFVFLQSWRATLIPAIAVPVVLLGTFAILYLFGFSINTMTLFGMVLAIGLLVDDAIVVVENVERLMHENPEMSPREATIQSMKEISVALVAIALVLSAVFLPMAAFGGSTGVIYRQFSVTLVSAMALSVLVALVLSPALTTHLLKQEGHDRHASTGWLARTLPGPSRALGRFSRWFTASFEKLGKSYQETTRKVFGHKLMFMGIYGLVIVLLALLFIRLPTGFLPLEDTGRAQITFRLPAGATMARSETVQKQIEAYFQRAEPNNVRMTFTVAGGGGAGASGQNTGQGYLNFADWDQRKGKANGADAITTRATAALRSIRDAQIQVTVPAAIRGLGQSAGFTLELQNISAMPAKDFAAARDQLMDAARNEPMLTNLRLTDLPDTPTLRVTADPLKLSTLGLQQSDVNATLSTAWGGTYVNDFVDRGRVKRVYVEGDSQFRGQPSDINQWYVRGASGTMTPFSAFASTGWTVTPTSLSRFNGVPAYEFSGQSADGFSSGQAMDKMEELAKQIPGVGVAWAGLSYQERLASGQAPLLYALSLLVVFLCLAALYESWSVPVAVLLVIPLGLVGAILAVTLRGLLNDVYLQIGLLTTMGLAAKNAILIVEFAEAAEKRGASPVDAALEAAKLRLRPILMTSLAFVFGVMPLALSTGAGANSRIAIGTAVVGGMLTATILAIFYIPLFFVIVRTGFRGKGGHKPHGHGPDHGPSHGPDASASPEAAR